MYRFDFNILEPAEFESLVADVITIRENTIHKTHYTVITQGSGPDKGVDFKLNNGEIIGQAKRYLDKDNLLSDLKREVEKVRNLCPKRYVLIVSIPLTYALREKIRTLFHPYISSDSDIIDQSDLNRLLEEHRHVLLKHNKLWLSSTHILRQVMEETINKALHDLASKPSAAELKEIIAVKDYFVSTNFFPQGIDILRKKNFLIITGEPGIGKTTLARAICHYFLEYRNYKELHYHHGTNPPLTIPDTKGKSIFFLDDFLGTTIYSDARIRNIGFFQNFVEKVQKDGHLLVVTTREYIYQQEKRQNPRFRQLDGYKYVITHTGYSDAEKLQILLNAVSKAELPYNAVNSLMHFAAQIIKEPNYRPKLVSEFLKNEPIDHDGLGWGYALLNYIRSPYDYWELTFLEGSPAAQLLLLCLFISNDPCPHTFLYQTYKSISQYRQISLPGYEADTFHEAIRELNDTFIYIDKNTVTNELAYSFIGTFIKDFLLEYLRRNDHIIEHLIKGAVAYNQLFYAFTNRKDEFVEDISKPLLFNGKKILLNEGLQKTLLNKILTDFEDMSEMRTKKIKWNNKDVTFERINKKDNKILRLQTFVEQFDVNKNYRADKFVKNWIKRLGFWEGINDDFQYDDRTHYLNDDELEKLPVLLSLLNYQTKADPAKMVETYYYSITRTCHFLSFYELRKKYTSAFDDFVRQHRTEIAEHLEDIIFNDIVSFHGFYYQLKDIYAYYALKRLFDNEILDAYEHMNLKLKTKQWNEWLKRADMDQRKMARITSEDKEDDDDKQFDVKRDKTDAMANARLKSILPRQIKPLTRKQIDLLITTCFPDQCERILLMVGKRKFLYELIRCSQQLDPLIGYCIQSDFSIAQCKTDFVFNYASSRLKSAFTEKEVDAIIPFAEYAAREEWEYFKPRQFDDYAREVDCDRSIFEKLTLSGLLTFNNGWYTFLLPEISSLFRALHLICQSNKKKIYLSGTYPEHNFDYPALWPYLGRLDKADFLGYFVYPLLERFYLHVKDDDLEKLLRKYFRFFGVRVDYKIINEKIRCRIYMRSNEITNKLFDHLNIRLSEKIFNNFPFESAYFASDVNDQHCEDLLRHIRRKCPDQQNKSAAFSAIRNKMFWQLFMQTDLAELIQSQMLELGRYLDKLKSSYNMPGSMISKENVRALHISKIESVSIKE